MRLIFALFLVFFFLYGTSISAQQIPGQIIVQLGEKSSIDLVLSDIPSSNPEIRLLSKCWNVWLLSFPQGNDELRLNLIRKNPAVVAAQFNHRASPRSITPNDTLFPDQWNLKNTGQLNGMPGADISAAEAWELGTGGVTVLGDTIVIAIVDEGMDIQHQDLHFWKNRLDPPNGFDDDLNGYIDDYNGWDVETHSDSIPIDYHGTHCAGIAAAIGNNITGVVGVAFNARIMPVCIFDYEEAQVVEAYSYIFDMRRLYNNTAGQKGAFIVAANSSFGIDFGKPQDYPLWCAMYDSLGAVGVLSVSSAPNLNTNVDIAGDIPSSCPSDRLIVVTNTNRFDVKTNGAAIGANSVDLGAPGTAIYSTTPSNNFGYQSGTSMSTAHVTGAVALMYSVACADFMMANRNNPGNVSSLVKDYILNGSDSLSTLIGLTVSGGRLNVYNSMRMVTDYCMTGLSSNPNEKSLFEIYPNPVGAQAILQITFSKNPFRLVVSDVSGRTVIEKIIPPSYGEKIVMDFSELRKGVYFIKVEGEDAVAVKKIIRL